MKTSMEMVREFHEAFGVECHDIPHIDDGKLNGLRLRLLQEEFDELSVALANRNLVEVLDALTDLQYILDGTYLALGFSRFKDAATAEVHRSNMSKLDLDGKPILRSDGKVMKGPEYMPPDLVPLIKGVIRQRCQAAASLLNGDIVHHDKGLYPSYCMLEAGHDGPHKNRKHYWWPNIPLSDPPQPGGER